MKWNPGKSLMKEAYTALVSDDGRVEFGRYWHRAAGFVPDSKAGNTKARASEGEARRAVVDRALDRLKGQMEELGWIVNELGQQRAGQVGTEGRNVPRGMGKSQIPDLKFQIRRREQGSGRHCRDCADENGVCPHDGTPCDKIS